MKYNGHRSWNAWNVSLWINNSEWLYNYCLGAVQSVGRTTAARHIARSMQGERTPDGAKYNRLCIYEALEGME